MGGANLKTRSPTQGKIQSDSVTASLFAGVDKDFMFHNTRLSPTAYVVYHHIYDSKFRTKGTRYNPAFFENSQNVQMANLSYSGARLFARDIRTYKPSYLAANLGIAIQHHLGETLRLSAHLFYERNLTGGNLHSKAQFVDFQGRYFKQSLHTARDLMRLGIDFKLQPETVGFYGTLGLDYAKSFNGDHYTEYSADLKFGYKFF